MARKRSIDPDIWTDDKFVALSDARACLLYVGLISLSDDFGRIEWSSRQLFGRLFASREDVKIGDVARWMEDVVDANLMVPYVVGNRTFAFHPKWKTHQYVSRPTRSRIPEPPPDLFGRATENIRTDSAQTTKSPRNSHVPSDTVSDTDTVLELYASLRSAALAVGSWPDDTEGFQALAITFIARFANCRDRVKAVKLLGAYTSALTAMQSRGATIEQAWTAAQDAWSKGGEVPLFGDKIKYAISQLRVNGPAAKPKRTFDRGAELTSAVAAQQERKRKAAGL